MKYLVASFLALAFVGAPALADDPAGTRAIARLSDIKEVVTSVSVGPVRFANPCALETKSYKTLNQSLANALMEAGFPKATPSPVLLDVPPSPLVIKRSFAFNVEATMVFEASACILAMRAELSLPGEPRMVLWSTPITTARADSGTDQERYSKDLQSKFDAMLQTTVNSFMAVRDNKTFIAPDDYLTP
jgi:hypothetical protein